MLKPGYRLAQRVKATLKSELKPKLLRLGPGFRLKSELKLR